MTVSAADGQSSDSTDQSELGPAKKAKDSDAKQTDATTASTDTGQPSDPSANMPTPIATVIVANSAIDSTPGSVANAANTISIGAQAKSRLLAAASRMAGPDAGTPQASDSKANVDAAATDAAAAGDAAKATSDSSGAQSQAVPANSPLANAQQMLPQPDAIALQGDAAAPASPGAGAAAAPHSSAAGAAGATDGANASSQAANAAAAKAAAANVPTLGFVVANPAAAATQTAAAPGDAASAPSVSVAGLAVAIASRAQAGSNQFDIRLDPPELGHIEVQLSVDSNGQVTSHITADRQDTLNLLQNQQPQLQQALEQAGLKTSDNGLQFSLRDQSFTGQQQQNQNFGQNGNGTQSNTQQIVIPDSSLPALDTSQIYSRLNLRGGLDIRV